jgi:hypothetical protein
VTSQTGYLRSSARTIAHSDRRIEVLVSNLLPVDIPDVYYSGTCKQCRLRRNRDSGLKAQRRGAKLVLFVIEGMHKCPRARC